MQSFVLYSDHTDAKLNRFKGFGLIQEFQNGRMLVGNEDNVRPQQVWVLFRYIVSWTLVGHRGSEVPRGRSHFDQFVRSTAAGPVASIQCS
jgi:hypothetical protein